MSYLPLDIDYLTKEIALKAEKELGETSVVRKEALERFRKAIRDEQSLTCPTDDNFLLMFLRARKFDVRKALCALKEFLIMKYANKDIFGDINLEIVEDLVKKKIITVLPYRDCEGCAIVTFRYDNFDFEKIPFTDYLMTMTALIILVSDMFPASQICGVKLIEDAKLLGLKHWKYITPRTLILAAKAMSGALPCRMKGFHILNASGVIDWMWNVAKFAVSKKVRERVHIYRGMDLKACFDPALLPEEFGGTLKYNEDFLLRLLREKEHRIHQISNGRYSPK